MTQVLTAVGSMWESRIATTLEASREVQISRRCADLADLLAIAGAGLGEVALVSSDLRGLDLSAVDDLHRHGLHVVGLTVSDSESEERWLRSVGVDAVVPVRAGLAELEAHLLARTPGGAGEGGPPGLEVGSRAGHGNWPAHRRRARPCGRALLFPCGLAQVPERAACTSSWVIGTILISTRRFLVRPSGVSLLATGMVSPKPWLRSREAGTPREAR